MSKLIPMSKQSKQAQKPTQSLRRAKSRFRFDSRRDSVEGIPLSVQSAYVFVHGARTGQELVRLSDDGVFGAPVAVLHGYDRVGGIAENLSVTQKSDSHITGRAVEMSMEEIALLDQVQELSEVDGHRFLADVVLPQAGIQIKCWVFQNREHMRPAEEATSVRNLSESAKQLQEAA